jgi:hypothetical protein
MQRHEGEGQRPDPGNDKDPKRTRTFWLLVIIGALLAAITVNLINRL